MEAYPYQLEAVRKVVSLLEVEDRVLLQSPTGSGKTFIAAHVVRELLNRDPHSRVLFVVNRVTLLSQGYETFRNLKIPTSVIHNQIKRSLTGEWFETKPNNNVIITMIETGKNVDLDFEPDLIIIDEAHKGTSESYQQLTKKYNSKILGLTATPSRVKNEEGEHLREWYGDNVVQTISIEELIELGQLVEPKYFKETDQHLVQTWLKYTKGQDNKKTIVFCEDTKHLVRVVEAFKAENISVEAIMTNDEVEGAKSLTPNQRNEVFNKFSNGEIDVLVSINALCEGFDERAARFCFLCRNIGDGNISLYTQVVGRVLRSHPSKSDAYVIDFAENIERFGYVEHIEWKLDDEYLTRNLGKEREIGLGEFNRYTKIHVVCSNCNHVYNAKEHDNCNYCGEATNLKTFARISDLRDMLVENIDKKIWERFVQANTTEANAFRHVIEKIKFAKQKKMGYKFNQLFGGDFFVDNSTLNQKYNWLDKCESFRMDEKMVVEI